MDPELKLSMERLSQLQSQPRDDSPQSFLESVRKNHYLYPQVGGLPRALEIKNLELRPGLEARLYLPNAKGNLPVLVYAHGGGFAAGSLESHDVFLRALTDDAGVAVLAIAYRLAPEFPLPAALEDLHFALNWLEQNGKKYGLDPTRAAISGDSAGGGLAGIMALEWNRQPGRVSLKAQLLIQPNTDLSLEQNSWGQNRPFGPTPAEMTQYLSFYLPLEHNRKDPRVSLLFNPDFENAPHTVLVTGGCDPLEDDGKALGERLEDAGIALEHLHFEEVTHGFYFHLGAVELSRRGVLEMGRALSRALEGQAF